MKKHLELFRALVALAVFGNAASRSLQVPVETQQRALTESGLGQGGPRGPAGGFGGGFGDGSPGLFGENPNDRMSGGRLGAASGTSFGLGAGAGRPTGFPGGRGDSFGRGSDLGVGPGAGAGFDRRPGSPDTSDFLGGRGPTAGSGGGFGFGSGPSGGNVPFSGATGTGGRRGVGGLPGSQGALGRPSPTLGSMGNGLGGQLSGTLDPTRLPGLEGERPVSPGFGPSTTGNGPLSPGGIGGPSTPGGLFPEQSMGNGPATFGGENAGGSPLSGSLGGSQGQGLGSPSLTNGPQGTAGIGGNAVGGGFSPTQSNGSGPVPPFGSQAGSGNLGLPSPGGAGGPGSFVNGSPTSTGSNGPGATGPAGPGGARPGTSLSSRHPGTQRGTQPKKLSPEDAAAIGLGVASSALAFGALAAGIISAVNQRKQARLRATARPSGATGAAGAAGPAGKPPCASNTGRRRRSIAESKVSAEVLDSIPMNFEHLD